MELATTSWGTGSSDTTCEDKEVPPSRYTFASSNDSCRSYDLLLLQCHSEGVLWRGLLPLLLPRMTVPDEGAQIIAQSIINSQTAVLTNSPHNRYTPIDESGTENDGHYHGSCKHYKCKPSSISRCCCCCRRRRMKLGASSSIAQANAFTILTKHFRNHIRRIDVSGNTSNGNNQIWNNDMSYGIINPHARCLLIQRCTRSRRIPIILILLPPNTPLHPRQLPSHRQYYSRSPSTAPTNPWSLRLLTYEKYLIRLTSVSAYMSTLGGGFFLCRYLTVAVAFARHQCAIAWMCGDTLSALKCRINEGYCYIHMGKLNKGKKVIHRVLRDVIRLQLEQGGGETASSSSSSLEDRHWLNVHSNTDVELSEIVIVKNMCHSALRFANLIRRASSVSKEEEEKLWSCGRTSSSLTSNDGRGGDSSLLSRVDDGSGSSSSQREKMILSPTHDDYQRIRVVPDRKWRCVE